MNFDKLKIFIIVILSVLFLSIMVLTAFLFVQNKKAETYYKQGFEYYNKNDYQNAYYNFSKILPFSDLFLNSLYKQAQCADILNDNKTSIKKYNTLEIFIKNEDITPYFLWRKGNIYLDLKNTKKANSTFLKLKKQYPDTEYAVASNFMLYQISKNPSFLIQYLEKSQNGKFSKDAIKILLDNKFDLKNEEKIILAKALYENSDYINSYETLKNLPLNLSFEYLIKSMDKLNLSSDIVKILDKTFELKDLEISEDVSNELISIYLKYSNEAPFTTLDNVYKITKNSNLKASIFNKSISYFNKDIQNTKKIKLYEKYPNSKYAKDAIFDLFMDNLINNKDKHALKYGKIYLSLYDDRNLTPCILYFTIYLKKKNQDLSYKEDLKRLLYEYQNSYYSYLAYKNFNNFNFKNKRNAQISSKINIPYPILKDKKIASFYENFIKYNDFSAFDNFRIKNQIVQSWIEYKKGNRATSSVIAREYIKNLKHLPKREDVIWKLAYPIYYRDEINHYSKQRNLNPYLMLALIKEESHFNPSIKSYVGATGLMQIMPSTAEMITNKTFSDFELEDEKLNIEIGTEYFSYLMGEFYNNEASCVLSYNSGPNAVKMWLNKNPDIPFEIMVEKIPYGETKTYIKKVYGAFWNYLLTYENIKSI